MNQCYCHRKSDRVFGDLGFCPTCQRSPFARDMNRDTSGITSINGGDMNDVPPMFYDRRFPAQSEILKKKFDDMAKRKKKEDEFMAQPYLAIYSMSPEAEKKCSENWRKRYHEKKAKEEAERQKELEEKKKSGFVETWRGDSEEVGAFRGFDAHNDSGYADLPKPSIWF